VRDLKPAKEEKGSGKIEHGVERHETWVNENAEDIKKNQEQEAAGQSAGFEAREGGEG